MDRKKLNKRELKGMLVANQLDVVHTPLGLLPLTIFNVIANQLLRFMYKDYSKRKASTQNKVKKESKYI